MSEPPQPAADAKPAAADEQESRGLARDFAGYAELEYERRRNSFDDFDADTFTEAVELVKKKLRV
jgi:hypothetical protein